MNQVELHEAFTGLKVGLEDTEHVVAVLAIVLVEDAASEDGHVQIVESVMSRVVRRGMVEIARDALAAPVADS